MNIFDLGITQVAAITVICYLVGLIAKAIPIDNKYIPAIVGVAGGILGVVASYVMPDFMGGDILTAIAIGIVSGLASTGANELVKQLSKAGDNNA